MNIRLFTKNFIAVMFYYSGFFKIIMMINNVLGRRLTVLLYHRLTQDDINSIKHSLPYLYVRQDSFEKQIKLLKKHYSIITFESMVSHSRMNKKLRKNSLIISFDDG